jgi:rhamnosyl/mannosyltransferase
LLTGLTVPPGDADALAAAIERLLSDVPLRQRLGAAGRARVRAEFDVDVMGRRVMEIYDEALRGAGVTAGAVA